VIRDLYEWVRAHRDDLLADVAGYVSIETPSDDKAALTAGLSWVDSWLRDRLGEPGCRPGPQPADRPDLDAAVWLHRPATAQPVRASRH